MYTLFLLSQLALCIASTNDVRLYPSQIRAQCTAYRAALNPQPVAPTTATAYHVTANRITIGRPSRPDALR